MTWEEPCIVFSPHWSLRLGPVVHLLHRWHANHKCLLILEQGVDAEAALSPFETVAIKVLQCSFLSGIKADKIQPLLQVLQPKLVLGCEREVAESGSTENKNESLTRLSWALVHSRQPEDVNRGIAMLEASLNSSNSPLQMREKLYLLAVGHYRSGDYSRSRQLLEKCLEIAPEWRQASSLKKVVEDKIAKDGVIGIGIAATAVGLVVGGIAAAVARKR